MPSIHPARDVSSADKIGEVPERHRRVTGLSGNEIFCLRKMSLSPGNLCVGNSVISLGVKGGLTAGLNILAGGEVPEITGLIYEGRRKALGRIIEEAKSHTGYGVAGVSTEIIGHAGNIEFLSIGSVVHRSDPEEDVLTFSSSADAQQLYCQADAGFHPMRFVFGNVAYSVGLGGNMSGFLRSLKRGEVKEYTEIFDKTRHLALDRICKEAVRVKANAVVGIITTISPFLGAQEMLMIGTASSHKALVEYADTPVPVT